MWNRTPRENRRSRGSAGPHGTGRPDAVASPPPKRDGVCHGDDRPRSLPSEELIGLWYEGGLATQPCQAITGRPRGSCIHGSPRPQRALHRIIGRSSATHAGTSGSAEKSANAPTIAGGARHTRLRRTSQAKCSGCCLSRPRQRATRRSRAEAPKSMRARATTQSRRPRPPRLPRSIATGDCDTWVHARPIPQPWSHIHEKTISSGRPLDNTGLPF